MKRFERFSVISTLQKSYLYLTLVDPYDSLSGCLLALIFLGVEFPLDNNDWVVGNELLKSVLKLLRVYFA